MTTPPPDWPRDDLCDCEELVYWYTTADGWIVCRCGHPALEHLNGTGVCAGEIEVHR